MYLISCISFNEFLFMTFVSLLPPSRRSVFDLFNFLASKHRQPPEYRPHEDDEEEGHLRTARCVRCTHNRQSDVTCCKVGS